MTARELVADRRWRWTAIVAAVLVVLLLIVASFPFGWFKPSLERDWSRRLGQPVTIGEVGRASLFSFTPTIIVRDVRVAQPAWAGKGNLATIERGTFRFNVFSALTGHFQPRAVTLSGLRLALVRDAEGASTGRRRPAAAIDQRSTRWC